MTDKLTIRDFLVYFTTGLFLLAMLMYRFGSSLLELFKVTTTDIKDNSALTIFFLVPVLYILGHLVHAVNAFLSKIGQYIIWFFKKIFSSKPESSRLLWIPNFFNFVINGNRVKGILNAKKQDKGQFWKRVHKLRYEGKSDNLEYYYLLCDLHKGLAFICVTSTILYFIEHDRLNTIISAALAILFWYRARYMAKQFVAVINNTKGL